MQYLGGKSRTYKEICAFLESVRQPNQPFVEPFCGACWITQGMSGPRYASDANQALITMWKALQSGWVPDDTVSREQHSWYKQHQPVDDPMTAVVGFGYSFGGDWFCGYCTHENKAQHLGNPKNTLLKKMKNLQGVKFKHQSYLDVSVDNCLIYCDPPYASTTRYSAVDSFDSNLFWQTMREWVNKGNTVVVSEYVAPDDFVCVWSKQTKTEIRTKEGRADRIEKLFMHESQAEQSLTKP